MKHFFAKLRLKHNILMGVITGWIVYICLISYSYKKLESRIEHSLVFQELFKEDPAMLGLLETYNLMENQERFAQMVSQSRIRVLSWRMLMNMGVLESDKTVNDVGYMISIKVISSILCETCEINNLIDKPGVEYYSEMLQSLGNTDEQVYVGGLEKVVSKVLANSPGAYESYLKGINDEQRVGESLGNVGFFRKFFAYALPREIGFSLWGHKASINELIGLTMSHLEVSVLFDELDRVGTDNSQSIQEEKRQVEEFARRILIATNNSQGVTNAREWVMIFQGPMQLIMIITFFICLSLLATKLSRKILDGTYDINKQEGARDWMFKTLPIFGFIGTILGLMEALGDAYKIPLAQGSSSTAIAISEITGQLGIAFTTTLMAFTMAILLGLLELVVENF